MRRSWAYMLKDVAVMIFVVGLGDYDVNSFDIEINQAEESLNCWVQFLNYERLPNVPIILVFTKKDIFDQKFGRKPLEASFPSWSGKTKVEAFSFFKDMYLEKMKEANISRHVSVEFVSCFDSDDCERLLKSTIDLVVNKDTNIAE